MELLEHVLHPRSRSRVVSFAHGLGPWPMGYVLCSWARSLAHGLCPILMGLPVRSLDHGLGPLLMG